MRRVLLVLPLLALGPLSACSTAPAPRAARQAGALAVTAASPGPTRVTPGAQTPSASGPDDLDQPQDPQQRALTDSWLLPDPRGTIPQIALRFMKALQRGDDLAAERQLTHVNRVSLAFGDLWTLHRVMSDVRKNAGLAQAGQCTRARQISPSAAVVFCGHRRVVMSVGGRFPFRGVHLSDWTKHYDVYRGAHTHAYTTVEF